MTPAEFMTEIALPTVLEARDARQSRRHAYVACIMVFHIKDHLKEAGETGIEAAMRAATGQLFDAVRGVCNGTKHVQTNSSHPIPFTVGDDLVRPPAFFGVMRFGRSFFGDTKGGRDIRAGAGRVDLYAACAGVMRAYATLYPQHFSGCDLTQL